MKINWSLSLTEYVCAKLDHPSTVHTLRNAFPIPEISGRSSFRPLKRTYKNEFKNRIDKTRFRKKCTFRALYWLLLSIFARGLRRFPRVYIYNTIISCLRPLSLLRVSPSRKPFHIAPAETSSGLSPDPGSHIRRRSHPLDARTRVGKNNIAFGTKRVQTAQMCCGQTV